MKFKNFIGGSRNEIYREANRASKKRWGMGGGVPTTKKASGFHLTEVHHGWDRWDSHQSIYRYQIKI